MPHGFHAQHNQTTPLAYNIGSNDFALYTHHFLQVLLLFSVQEG
jgi:hypothetical protein